MNTRRIRYSIPFILLLCFTTAYSQNRKVSLNGGGRAITTMDMLGGQLMETDTTSLDRALNGYALFDLDLTIRPNKVTQIEAIFRLRNEFGGFWGSGVVLDIQKLYIEGLIKDVLRYRVGDFNLELTPYTLFNPKEDGVVNEASVFNDFKQFHYTDNFYDEERWRLQGLQFEFGLTSDKVFKEMEFMTFLSRTRGASLFSTPEQFYAGAHWAVEQSEYFNLGVNYVNLFDIPSTVSSDRKFNNGVISIMAEGKKTFGNTLMSVNIEGGQSSVVTKNDPEAPDDISDTYIDLKINAETDFGLDASLGFKDVGPEFFSAGAQTRRLDLRNQLDFFPNITNEGIFRSPTQFDYVYEEALYNQQINVQLDDMYQEKFNITYPYGAATPNRRGVYAVVTYVQPKDEFVTAKINMDYMTEVVGEGTEEKRNFFRLRAQSDFYLNRVIESERKYLFTIGLQQESSNRSGTEIESVDLSALLLEVGSEIEIFKQMDVVLGLKYHTANGKEYSPDRDEYNQIFKYDLVNLDESDLLLAGGLKYNFNENVFASVQYVRTNISNELSPDISYSIDRVLTAFHMKF